MSASGQVRYSLGDRLADRYLEFAVGPCRPNTLRAAAFDLKTFFTVIAEDPWRSRRRTCSISWPISGGTGR